VLHPTSHPCCFLSVIASEIKLEISLNNRGHLTNQFLAETIRGAVVGKGISDQKRSSKEKAKPAVGVFGM
jgi:hypothetical protein